MAFLSPIWLWLAIPWAAVTVWLLRGRGRDTRVPFVALWQDATHTSRSRRRWRLPPTGVLLLLAAMLLGIGAAAEPAVVSRESAEPITVIWDRGIAMAGRHAEVADELSAAFATGSHQPRRVRLAPVPGDQTIDTDTRGWLDQARQLSLTAVDTGAILRSTIAATLRQTDQPIIVVTSARPAVDDPRLIVVTPTSPPRNVRIEQFAFRDDPKRQAMVHVGNQGGLTRAILRILAHDRVLEERSIDLPPTGETGSYYIDLAESPDVLAVELVADDATDIDNRAWLTRQSRWPRIMTASPMPPAVQRVIDIYTAQRPSDDRSPTLVISRQPLADRIAGIILSAADQPAPAGSQVGLSTHPLVEDVPFERLDPLRVSGEGPPEGFTLIAQLNGQPLIAVRDAPARQVWVGFDSPSFAMTPGFVVLWAKMLEWVGGEAELYAAREAGSIGGTWQRIAPGAVPDDVKPGWVAGLYRDAVGRLVAVNPAVPRGDDVAAPSPTAPTADWRESLALLSRSWPTAAPMGHWLAGAAVLLGLAAAVCWSPAGLTRLYGRRTVPS